MATLFESYLVLVNQWLLPNGGQVFDIFAAIYKAVALWKYKTNILPL